jgi:hypothetical protein
MRGIIDATHYTNGATKDITDATDDSDDATSGTKNDYRFSGRSLRGFFKFVNLEHNNHRKRVIFIGDDAQLPPVGMKLSPALSAEYLLKNFNLKVHQFELTEVVHQRVGSGVLNNSIQLRKGIDKYL